MKYNYVVLGSDSDFYRVSYADLGKRQDAVYLWKSLDNDNPLLTLFYRAHTSPKVNKIIKFPLQSLWNGMLYHDHFEDDKPICFIFFVCRKKEIDNGFMRFLKSKYSGCKTVLFYQDLVERSLMPNIQEAICNFDLILSFDQGDVEKYNLLYYPLVYSNVEIPAAPAIMPSDVYFVGKAKDRLETIIAAYECFRDAGLKCDFHITGVETENRRYSDEIVYQDSMPYIENLQRIRATKCLLEVMQQGGHGYTLRYCEAIMYGKKVITNNPEIESAPFYKPEYIQVFDEAGKIRADFIQAKSESEIVDYEYKEKISPIHLLEFVDKKL